MLRGWLPARASRSASTCAGSLPRARRPGTQSALIPCRAPRRLLARSRRPPLRGSKRPSWFEQLERAVGSRREESLRLRSCFAVKSALLTRQPPSTRGRWMSSAKASKLCSRMLVGGCVSKVCKATLRKRGAGTRLERFHASTSVNAFWLPRDTTVALSRATEVVTRQLVVDRQRKEYERKSRFGLRKATADLAGAFGGGWPGRGALSRRPTHVNTLCEALEENIGPRFRAARCSPPAHVNALRCTFPSRCPCGASP